jgi:L-threonylcarbamoyladenylate synthase
LKPISAEQLDAAASALESGGLVVVPTERWYMICADATNLSACESIFAGKQRPRTKSLVYVASSRTECQEQFVMHPEAGLLADAFWPGNLAMLLPWRSAKSDVQHSTVGAPALVTIASDALGELAAATQVPVAATTVNISGDAGVEAPGPAITVEQVQAFLDSTQVEAAVVLDGGIAPAANHLTIVDCSTAQTSLTRPGLLHERALVAALGRQLT